jgi:predicted nuclease of predicted toxin-antitoxin system
VILADENIDHKIIEAIREAGVEIYSIYETNRGLSDEAIIQLSKEPPRIILTEDKDFGEWVFAHNEKNISVIFLRYSFLETQKMINTLLQVLLNNNNLFGNYTTLTTTKIRSRNIK